MKKVERTATRKKPVEINYISLKVSEDLYDLIAQAADKLPPDLAKLVPGKPGVPMNEFVVLVLADYFGRHDLCYVPRLPQGRHRTVKEPA